MRHLAACLALGFAVPAAAQVVGGAATIIDGDTLDFSGTYVRLIGVDAPAADLICQRSDENWNCGAEARRTLAELIAGRKVECVVKQRTEAGTFGHCTADGIDLSDAMARSGFAVVPPNGLQDYTEAQEIARKFSLGIWGSRFEDPVHWRSAKPPAIAADTSARVVPAQPHIYRDNLGRCAIKGNHSRYGDWIYHLPGQPYYEETRPEARFCTEEAAQRAGYRPSKAG